MTSITPPDVNAKVVAELMPTENDDLVSVVIATRDRPEMLRRAIDAINASDYEGPIEIVVVFDQCDPDLTIVSDDPRRQVRAIANARTQGLAGGRNTGAFAATGRWLAFCDDDDEWLPAKLRQQVDLLRDAPKATLATTGIYIRYDGEDFDRIPEQSRLTFDGFLDDRMTEVHPSSFVMDRDWFINDIGLVDEELPGSYAEDYDVLLRAARIGQVLSVPEPLVTIHWHPSTYFRERWTMIDDALGALVDKHPEFAGAPAGLARVRGQQAFAAAAAGDRRRALKMIVETIKLRPLEKRTLPALAVVMGVPAGVLLRLAHRMGRGI